MADSPSKLGSFLSELKRRRVYRVAIVYAGVAFVIIQLADYAFEQFNVSSEFGRFLTIVLALGFLIVIALAWAFDITDEGIVRAKGRPADTKRKAQPLLGNKSLAVIAVLAIIVAAWALLRGPSQPGGSVIRSLAVLPLHNLSGDPEQEYIADGMHDQLISALCGINAIEVRGRQSTLQYKNSEKTIPVITSELNVDALVESSVLPLEDRVRITVQLVDSQDRHLWENTYDRNLEDVFALYDEVTRAIVQEIRATLTLQEEERLASAPQVNSEAWKLYTKGWELRLLEISDSTTKAIEYLEQAVELDPDFARAWAAVAVSYYLYGAPNDLMYEALDRALELDPNDVLALTWQGVTLTGVDYNLANTSFRRALDLEPGNVYARYEYGMFLWRWGQPSAALAELRQAQELDPINSLPPRGFVWVYNRIRQNDKALEYIRLRDELRNVPATDYPGYESQILMQQGRYEEAAAKAEEAGNLWVQLRAEWALGNSERVYAIRDSMVVIGEWPQQEQDDPWSYARFYGLVGEKEQALGLLEMLPEVGTTSTATRRYALVYNPEFDSLRAEPRFKVIMQERGGPEVFDENGNLLQPIDETLEAYNAPGSR